MAAELFMPSPRPEPAAEADYETIYAAVAATTRGRWFLAEFARRDRHNDTAQLLSAIARIEAVVTATGAPHASQQTNQQIRMELLEMARTIAQTRAEIAENGSEPPVPSKAATNAADANIAAAAERLRQIAWTMRACGVEIGAADQIGQIADAILATDAAHRLGVERSHKLAEVLHYLEHRIERMLDSHSAVTNAPEQEHAPAESTPSAADDQLAQVASVPDPASTEVVAAETEPSSPPMAEGTAIAAATAATDVADVVSTDDALPSADSVAESDAPQVDARDADRDAPVQSPNEPASMEAQPDSTPSNAVPPLSQTSSSDSEADELEALPDEGIEPAITAASAPPVATAPASDAITMQVDRDLDDLADSAKDDSDAADFLLDRPAHTAAADTAPRAAAAPAVDAKPLTALAAIASELRANPPQPTVRADSAPSKSFAAAAKPIVIADGPLAALMAMGEDERIALFS